MTTRHVMSTYKALLRAASDVPNYNFKHFFLRKVREGFRSHSDVTDQKEVAKLLLKAREDLLMIKRVGAMGNFYGTQRLVIEQEEAVGENAALGDGSQS